MQPKEEFTFLESHELTKEQKAKLEALKSVFEVDQFNGVDEDQYPIFPLMREGEAEFRERKLEGFFQDPEKNIPLDPWSSQEMRIFSEGTILVRLREHVGNENLDREKGKMDVYRFLDRKNAQEFAFCALRDLHEYAVEYHTMGKLQEKILPVQEIERGESFDDRAIFEEYQKNIIEFDYGKFIILSDGSGYFQYYPRHDEYREKPPQVRKLDKLDVLALLSVVREDERSFLSLVQSYTPEKVKKISELCSRGISTDIENLMDAIPRMNEDSALEQWLKKMIEKERPGDLEYFEEEKEEILHNLLMNAQHGVF